MNLRNLLSVLILSVAFVACNGSDAKAKVNKANLEKAKERDLAAKKGAAIISFDEDRLEEVYNEALSLYSIGVVTRSLLTPLLIELGLRWESKEGSIAEEHFFSFYLRNTHISANIGVCVFLVHADTHHC